MMAVRKVVTMEMCPQMARKKAEMMAEMKACCLASKRAERMAVMRAVTMADLSKRVAQKAG